MFAADLGIGGDLAAVLVFRGGQTFGEDRDGVDPVIEIAQGLQRREENDRPGGRARDHLVGQIRPVEVDHVGGGAAQPEQLTEMRPPRPGRMRKIETWK